jgi:hypothetical protein
MDVQAAPATCEVIQKLPELCARVIAAALVVQTAVTVEVHAIMMMNCRARSAAAMNILK